MIRPGSFFLDEGDFLLLQEFGKKYGNYYSILASIASGRDTMADILALFTGGSIGGQIKLRQQLSEQMLYRNIGSVKVFRYAFVIKELISNLFNIQ